MLVKISEIKVKKRVRKDLGDLDALKQSLRTYGLLNPITLNSKYELIAGERRLEAAKAIGWENINAIVLGRELDDVSQLEMELEENNQRKDFSDEELMAGYERLGRLRNPSFFARIITFFADLIERIVRCFHARFSGKKKKPTLPPPPPPPAAGDAAAQNLMQ